MSLAPQPQCTLEDEGKTLVIRVDLTAPRSPSKSGKTGLVASTHGVRPITPSVRMNLSVFDVEDKGN